MTKTMLFKRLSSVCLLLFLCATLGLAQATPTDPDPTDPPDPPSEEPSTGLFDNIEIEDYGDWKCIDTGKIDVCGTKDDDTYFIGVGFKWD